MSSVILWAIQPERISMTSDTRAKMVAGAADLMSRRGVNATSMREVVRPVPREGRSVIIFRVASSN